MVIAAIVLMFVIVTPVAWAVSALYIYTERKRAGL
jgi:hypothetical protein